MTGNFHIIHTMTVSQIQLLLVGITISGLSDMHIFEQALQTQASVENSHRALSW